MGKAIRFTLQVLVLVVLVSVTLAVGMGTFTAIVHPTPTEEFPSKGSEIDSKGYVPLDPTLTLAFPDSVLYATPHSLTYEYVWLLAVEGTGYAPTDGRCYEDALLISVWEEDGHVPNTCVALDDVVGDYSFD